MTTEKKNSLSERFKALRDQMSGLIKAAEEENSEAASACPEEAAEPESPSETELPELQARASEAEIVSALRGFTWGSAQESAESAVETEEDKASEETPEELFATDTEDASEEIRAESEVVFPQEDLWDIPEEPSESGIESNREYTLEDILKDVREEEAAVPEAETEQAQPEESNETPSSAFSGLAAFLARMKNQDEDQPDRAEENREEEKARRAEADLADAVAIFRQYNPEEETAGTVEETGDAQPESDIEPQDVAKLWEPHAHRASEEETGETEGELDADREETHVFTEEDLKNLPRDEEPGEVSAEDALGEDLAEEEEGYTPRDFHPIRRRRYYRSGIVGGIMYFLFVICVSVTLAAFAWLAADDVLSLNKEYLEAEVYVGEDMDVEQIATELHTKGLIRYKRLFAIFGKFFHAEDKIEPGTYTLSTKLDYRALIQNMHHYTGWTGEALETVKVTIPEGKTVMETFQILADHGVCPYETLMECAANESFDYSFLKDIPKGDATRLEGYLFPDTYEFYADSSPKAAICRFLDNFGERIPERVEEQAAAAGYTLREIVIVASLIEKEAGSDTERATIASVIYNRLQSTSYPYLQIDATIQYAMGEHKESLTNEDLEVDSPYNTYKYPGLPPGPIANPGLASIRAALNPESTGYYFYALDKSGKHKFFSSYNEFVRFINSSDFGG